MQNEGLGKTLQTVTSRLNSPSPLGYSCAGTVVAAGGLVDGIQPGDRVACGGVNYANHAEFVAVPKNLLVKVPANVSDEEAAFATVGSISLQGVRLAAPQLGETFLVLGLGLLGQIAVQLLRANGCTVIANDLDPAQVARAEGFGAIGAGPGVDLANLCAQLTGGHGVDGVLVCAGTASNQPIELCGAVTREKGRVVVVGAVRMDIPREDYFKKEISVVISRSYGPGRYDPFYEENGNDYPLPYVRFTEQRNMATFLDLVSQGKVDVRSLISHRYPVDRAADAYHLIEGAKTEPYLGIVIQYAAAAGQAPAAGRQPPPPPPGALAGHARQDRPVVLRRRQLRHRQPAAAAQAHGPGRVPRPGHGQRPHRPGGGAPVRLRLLRRRVRRAARGRHRRGADHHPPRHPRRRHRRLAAGRQARVRGKTAGADGGRAGHGAAGAGGRRQPADGGLQPPLRAVHAGRAPALRRGPEPAGGVHPRQRRRHPGRPLDPGSPAGRRPRDRRGLPLRRPGVGAGGAPTRCA
nr:zinc-binding alcohol dehydrogenase [Duganella sp. BJB1802]